MREVLEAFDRYLGERGLSFEGTAIGGAALIVMGVVDRVTQDVDCLEPPIPENIQKAARDFAKSYPGKGAPLKENWLNNGPASLVRDLPKDWEKRRVGLFKQFKLDSWE